MLTPPLSRPRRRPLGASGVSSSVIKREKEIVEFPAPKKPSPVEAETNASETPTAQLAKTKEVLVETPQARGSITNQAHEAGSTSGAEAASTSSEG